MIKAFKTPTRAAEYAAMLQAAPFPNQNADGYQIQAIDLS